MAGDIATSNAQDAERIRTLETELAARDAQIIALQRECDEVARERDLYRASHEQLRLELALLRRRILVAKAERVDTTQLELEFAKTLAALDQLAGTTPAPGSDAAMPSLGGDAASPPRRRPKPTGRRDLRGLPLEEERVEIQDDLFEKLVAEGKARRIGFEESTKLAYRKGGMRRLVIARTKYRAFDRDGESVVETTPMPPETFPRSMAAPSLLAHVLTDKFCDGLPLHRQQDRFARDGVPIDRGTMCRWVEDAGATLGATVVAAALAEAKKSTFCMATDATGVAVLPEPRGDGKRQPCRRGHFFVLVADKEHVFFEYTPRETSDYVQSLLGDYKGYVQADAKSVFDVLFRHDDTGPPARIEVGCASHLRRHFWEATVTKSTVAREGLARIGRIFALDRSWKDKPVEEILRLRNLHLRPHLEAFFTWAEAEYQEVKAQRGLVRTALGYAVRQKAALLRVLDDGRLVLENNRSERQLRRIATGRHAWLFVGSDDHAQSAANLFSLIASARLHGLDPEVYLRDLFRVLAHWPKNRYLELAPKYWRTTRARLDSAELADEVGPLTVPPLPSTEAPTEERSAD